MIAMGLYVSPADIIYGLEINGGLTVDGFLGTQGLGVPRHWLKPKSLDEVIKSCGSYILEYQWYGDSGLPGGWHYVNITYDVASDEFLIYNSENRGTVPISETSIDTWIEQHTFLAGLAISK